MSDDRLAQFNQHRAAVLKEHLKRDKTYQVVRAKRRRGFLLGTFQVVVGTFAVLALGKSLMLATNGPDEYARIVAPALQGLDAGHPLATALQPDSLTTTIAEALRPILANQTQADLAFGPPMPPDMVQSATLPES